MKIVHWALHGLAWLLVNSLLTLAHANVLALDHATAEFKIAGTTTPTEVSLPYGWDYHHQGVSGIARFSLTFDGPPDAGAPWALYFRRLGNAYLVKLNGIPLEQSGTLSDSELAEVSEDTANSDYAKVPRLIHIPAILIQDHNALEVTIRSDSGRRSGMPVVQVGPKSEIESIYRREFNLRVGGSVALSAFSLIVGIFAAVLWVTQTDPRPEQRGVRDDLYLFAALAECAWALFIGDTLIERPPLSWPVWSIVINMALGVWLSAMLMFCHTIAGWTQGRTSRWVRRVLLALLVTGPGIAAIAVTNNLPVLLTLWQAGFALIFVPSTVLFVAQAIRKASGMHRMVAAAFLLNVPIGIHDFYAMRVGDAFASQAYLRYSATLFGLALSVIAIDRFRAANLRVRDMLDTLATRIEDKQRELSQSYLRMETIAREQERVGERARILRDMHDGVGSHISSAIRQLRFGQSNPGEVLRTLQDSLDQLKLSIDALNLPPGDITALLANLRYRLEPRFRAMGLTLEWAVEPLPECPQLDASAMRQLQFIFFEAFSNAMQHAQASILRIEATPTPKPASVQGYGVRILVGDNGCGFDTATTPRTGLRSMQERARAIGAQLTIYSQGSGTTVEMLLPANGAVGDPIVTANT